MNSSIFNFIPSNWIPHKICIICQTENSSSSSSSESCSSSSESCSSSDFFWSSHSCSSFDSSPSLSSGVFLFLFLGFAPSPFLLFLRRPPFAPFNLFWGLLFPSCPLSLLLLFLLLPANLLLPSLTSSLLLVELSERKSSSFFSPGTQNFKFRSSYQLSVVCAGIVPCAFHFVCFLWLDS